MKNIHSDSIPISHELPSMPNTNRRRAERDAARDLILQERLAAGGPESWGPVFCERPGWEETELTAEQAAKWSEWSAEAKRQKLHETRENVLAMPVKSVN